MRMSDFVLYVALAVSGAFIGVLISILSRRIPAAMEARWRAEAEEVNAYPPSNAPLVNPSKTETAAVAVISGLLVVGLFSASPNHVVGLSLSAFALCLVLLSWIDARTYLLPDSLVYPLLWSGIAFNMILGFRPLVDSVIGVFAGYLGFWVVAKTFSLIRRKEGMGHGDFKLLAALGAWLGWQALPFLVVAAAVVGLVAAVGLTALRRGAGGSIPFGPSLSVAGLFVLVLMLCPDLPLTQALKSLSLV